MIVTPTKSKQSLRFLSTRRSNSHLFKNQRVKSIDIVLLFPWIYSFLLHPTWISRHGCDRFIYVSSWTKFFFWALAVWQVCSLVHLCLNILGQGTHLGQILWGAKLGKKSRGLIVSILNQLIHYYLWLLILFYIISWLLRNYNGVITKDI